MTNAQKRECGKGTRGDDGEASGWALFLRALRFAADRHRVQRRKGPEASAYIGHPIEVACLLGEVAGVTDAAVLAAALLHDTIEDTGTTPAELEKEFGAEVRAMVEEVTEDKSLEKPARKRRQVERAPELSVRAKLIKIADKTSNVRDVTHRPPADWSRERRLEYLEWSAEVVAGCRGVSPELEACYDKAVREGRGRLDK